MVERHSSAVQQVAGVGQQTVEDVRLTQSALWTPSGQITSRSGIVPTGTAAAPGSVLATSPTPNGFVHVQPFRAVLQSSRSGGVYVMCLDAIKDINILSTSADPSNARRDLIIAQQNDTYIGGDANSDMVVKQVVGTPSGSPVDPPVTGSADYIVLARVTVPAGASSITTGNITQLATGLTVATGGLLPVADATERAAIANPYDGMQIYRRDTDWVEIYDGGAWRVPNFARTTALANITNPVTDQCAFLTTDKKLYRWNGSTWVFVAPFDGSAPWGTMGVHRPTAAVTGSGTTEKVGCFVTFGAVLGRRYKATWNAELSCSVANASANLITNPGIVKMRVKAGTDGTAVDGTQIDGRDFAGLSNGYNIPFDMTADWVATATGTFTISATFAANSGATGNVTQGYSATNHTPKLIVEDIGV
ncbi:hypothetical protein [Amycolatopsis kentuckyensis]|uniref:hypothetical protein n=1 Tax=Amycolatopsis kentuckyensis TaxID=218823 RepID=UPI00117800FF|nr:hypothetical protein [Amycolatopsis kentuckyensis]